VEVGGLGGLGGLGGSAVGVASHLTRSAAGGWSLMRIRFSGPSSPPSPRFWRSQIKYSGTISAKSVRIKNILHFFSPPLLTFFSPSAQVRLFGPLWKISWKFHHDNFVFKHGQVCFSVVPHKNFCISPAKSVAKVIKDGIEAITEKVHRKVTFLSFNYLNLKEYTAHFLYAH